MGKLRVLFGRDDGHRAVPGHAELKLGTLASIIRQTGVPRTLFET